MASIREELESSFDVAKELPVENTGLEAVSTPVEDTGPDAVEPPIENKESKNSTRYAFELEDPKYPVEDTEQKASTVEAKDVPTHPNSWKKEYWEDFQKLDPKVAAYIHERESEFHKGLEQYKNQVLEANNKIKSWDETITPFEHTIKQFDVTPQRAVEELLKSDAVLRYGTAAEKIHMLRRIIADYRIDLNTPVGEINTQLPQPHAPQPRIEDVIDTRVNSRLSDIEAKRALDSFLATKPEYLDQVRGTMVTLLDSRVATDFQSAYDMAVWADPQLRQTMMTRQSSAIETKKREDADKAAKAARAKAVSVRGAPTGSSNKANGSSKLNIRSALEDAFDEHLARI